MKTYVKYKDFELFLKRKYIETGTYMDYFPAMKEYVLNNPICSTPYVQKKRSNLSFKEFMECINQAFLPSNDPANSSRQKESVLIPEELEVLCFKHLNYLNQNNQFHSCFDINYVYKGQAELSYAGTTRILNEGDLCIMAPHSSYRIDKEDDKSIVIGIYLEKQAVNRSFFDLLSNFGVISDFVRYTLYDQSIPNYLLFRSDHMDDLKEIIHSLYVETNFIDAYSPLASLHWTHLLFIAIARQFNFQESFCSVDQSSSHFYKILEFIHTNLASVNLNMVAREFGYNESYLSTLFYQKTKKNFTQYVQELKIDQAKKLLTSTALKLDLVAEKAGYHSTDHFSRSFKAVTGLTPGQYRKQNKNT